MSKIFDNVSQKDLDLIYDFSKQAWALSEEEIGNLEPGNIQKALDFIRGNESKLNNHCFRNRTQFEIENPDIHLLSMMRKPEFFPFTCKTLFCVDSNNPLTIMPYQNLMLNELWTRQFPMIIATRGGAKSYGLAIYALLRMMFCPGAKIIIVGSAFRQAKIIFEYMERLWYNSPVYRDLCGSVNMQNKRNNGPRRDIDRCEFVIGDSTAIAIPIGDGEKIRGIRSNYTLADEFKCLDKNTLIETDIGLLRLKDSKNLMGTFKLKQNDGSYISPTKFITTPPTEVYEVITKYGYDFKCSSIHKVNTQDGWKLAKDLTTEDYILCNNKYEFPKEQVDIVDKDLAYLMGGLISEGAINHKGAITYHNNNEKTIDNFISIISKFTKNKISKDIRKSYTDDRGWNCKQSFVARFYDTELREKLVSLGLDRDIAINKKIPWSILQSPKEIIVSFLSSLFDGDGSAFLWGDKIKGIKDRLGVSYYSSSKQLIDEVHILLYKLGFLSYKTFRKSKISDNPQYMIRLNGKNAYDFGKLLNIKRFNEVIEKSRIPFERINLGVCWFESVNKWSVRFEIFGKLKTFGFYENKEDAIKKSIEVYNSLDDYLKVRKVTKLEEKEILYDYEVPNTNAFYGNIFHQHNSINLEIYEQVIQAFGAVTSDPVRNTKDYSKKEFLKRIGLWNADIERLENTKKRGNQNVLSGTPSYSFNHFYKYWKEYKGFIETRNEPQAIRKLFNLSPSEPLPESFDARDFGIFRLPYELVPKGYMDDKTVNRAKQISNSAQFNMEYAACFLTDSDGFFKRSLIHKCEVGIENDKLPKFASCEGGYPDFSAVVRGDPARKYFYGIDPASENDRFAITIIEAWPDHRRIVYCWTTNKSDHREKLKRNVTSEHDFYKFCTRKIRDLMKVFPPARLMIDSGGGGITMRESFRDKDKLENGEQPIYEIIDENKPKPEDDLPGGHLIEMCVFRDTAWVSEANHGMKKDMEDQILLFPCLNSLEIGLAMEEDKATGRVILADDGEVVHLYDNLEDCMLEIEELKEELTMIVVSSNESGSEKWGTPAHKIPGQKRGVLRKDRYSSLLIANMGARKNHIWGLMNTALKENAPYNCYGGFAKDLTGKALPAGKPYSAPSWFTPCFGKRV